MYTNALKSCNTRPLMFVGKKYFIQRNEIMLDSYIHWI
jgi:hypothetical protein